MKALLCAALIAATTALTPAGASVVSVVLYDGLGKATGDFTYDTDAVAFGFDNTSVPGVQGGYFKTAYDAHIFGYTLPADKISLIWFNPLPGSGFQGGQINIVGSYSYDSYAYIHNIYPIYLATISTNFQISLGVNGPANGGSKLPQYGFGSGYANYSVSSNNSGYPSFSKSGFVAAIPEPASWALMIGGIGFAGGLMRRQRARAVTHA